jgi:hypothetical protein
MSVSEMKSEILKLSPDELNQLWDAIEDALDNIEADEALRTLDKPISWSDYLSADRVRSS